HGRRCFGFDGLSFGSHFFVQAEDGIRDFHVTGVQTCALPIFGSNGSRMIHAGSTAITANLLPRGRTCVEKVDGRESPLGVKYRRSEERRVGKECECRWTPRD